MTAETREHCTKQHQQITQEKVIKNWSNVGKRNKTTSGSQIVLWEEKREKQINRMEIT